MQKSNLSRKIWLIYRSDKFSLVQAIIFLGIVVAGGIYMLIYLVINGFFTPDNYILFIAIGSMLPALSLMIFLLSTEIRQYIKIFDDGIYYLGPDYQLYTPWSNIVGLSRQKISSRIVNMLDLKEAPSWELSIAEGRRQRRAVVARRHWLPIKTRYTVSYPLGSAYNKVWRDGELSRALQTAFAASQGYALPILTEFPERQPSLEVPLVAPPWFWLWLGGLLLFAILSGICLSKNWFPFSSIVGSWLLFGTGSYLFSLYHIYFAKRYHFAIFQIGLFASIIIGFSIGFLILLRFPGILKYFSGIGELLFFLFALPFLVLLAITARIRLRKLQVEQLQETQKQTAL